MKLNRLIVVAVFLIGCSVNSGNKISLPFAEAKWEQRTGMYEKKPILLKLNRALEKYVGSLPFQATMSVCINKPLPNGLPDESEKASLVRLETMLAEKLDKAGLAVYALEVITDKTCDFIFYTNKKRAIKEIFSETSAAFNDKKISMTVKKDNDWWNYKWFSSYVNTGMWGGL
jgi:hypothetical protein